MLRLIEEKKTLRLSGDTGSPPIFELSMARFRVPLNCLHFYGPGWKILLDCHLAANQLQRIYSGHSGRPSQSLSKILVFLYSVLRVELRKSSNVRLALLAILEDIWAL